MFFDLLLLSIYRGLLQIIIIKTVFSFRNEKGKFFHKKSLFNSSKIFSEAPSIIIKFNYIFVFGLEIVGYYSSIYKFISLKSICLSSMPSKHWFPLCYKVPILDVFEYPLHNILQQKPNVIKLSFFCHFDQREKSHKLLTLCDFSFVEMTKLTSFFP